MFIPLEVGQMGLIGAEDHDTYGLPVTDFILHWTVSPMNEVADSEVEPEVTTPSRPS